MIPDKVPDIAGVPLIPLPGQIMDPHGAIEASDQFPEAREEGQALPQPEAGSVVQL